MRDKQQQNLQLPKKPAQQRAASPSRRDLKRIMRVIQPTSGTEGTGAGIARASSVTMTTPIEEVTDEDNSKVERERESKRFGDDDVCLFVCLVGWRTGDGNGFYLCM